MPRPRAKTNLTAKDAVKTRGRPAKRAPRKTKGQREIDETRMRYYEGSVRETELSARVPLDLVQRVAEIRRGR